MKYFSLKVTFFTILIQAYERTFEQMGRNILSGRWISENNWFSKSDFIMHGKAKPN
jgi:hypothetical protein